MSSQQQPQPRIVVSDEVAAQLGPDQTKLVLAGEASAPVYECLICRGNGDMRDESTAAVLFTGDDAMILAWVHARCGSSAVHPVAEMEARYGRAGDAGQRTGPQDLTWASVVQLADGIYPSLTIMPGESTRAVMPAGPGEHLVLESALENLRSAGFGPVDLSGAVDPVEVPRWAVRVERGALVAITQPSSQWWASTERPPMPAAWREAARDKRRVLVMVLAPGALPDVEEVSVEDNQAAMLAAARDGKLVGALLPLRGSLS